MKKTNINRQMSTRTIEKSFQTMIDNRDAESLVEFVELYPHFVNRYTDLLLDKVKLINHIVSKIRANE